MTASHHLDFPSVRPEFDPDGMAATSEFKAPFGAVRSMSIQLSVKRVITATVRVRKYNSKKSSYYLLIPHEQMRGLNLDDGDVLTLGLMGIERGGAGEDEVVPELRPTLLLLRMVVKHELPGFRFGRAPYGVGPSDAPRFRGRGGRRQKRRWILISFPNVFESDKANKNLAKELTAKGEISGLLNWAIEGSKRLRTS